MKRDHCESNLGKYTTSWCCSPGRSQAALVRPALPFLQMVSPHTVEGAGPGDWFLERSRECRAPLQQGTSGRRSPCFLQWPPFRTSSTIVGPVQNGNTLVPKRMKISRWQQQSPSGPGPLSVKEPCEHTGLAASGSGR